MYPGFIKGHYSQPLIRIQSLRSVVFIPSLTLALVLALGCVIQAAVVIRDQVALSEIIAFTAISSKTLPFVAYIERFAAAAYFPENNGGNPDATNYVVYCSAGTCPDVQEDMVDIAYKFYE